MEPERARELCCYLQTTLQLPPSFCAVLQNDPNFAVAVYDKLHLHFEKFQQALQKAYPDKDDLKEMIEKELGISFSSIPYYAKSYVYEIANVIRWAESQGYLLELIAAAHQENPRNVDLRVFLVQTIKPLIEALLPPSSATDHSTPTTFDEEAVHSSYSGSTEQTILQPGEGFTKLGAEFARFRPYICRIEVPFLTAEGTGFLIGRGVVITNYHVMRPVFQGNIPWDRVAVRFDYSEDQANIGIQYGTEYPLVENWSFVYSPPEKLDYVLLRLNDTPRMAPVFGRGDLERRGCLKPEAHTFRNNEALWIIQHPSGTPLRIAIAGTISRIDKPRQRIYYTTNTQPGSSGSPCLSKNGAVVALHCAGNSYEKEGIPFSAILTDIRAQGFASVISQ